MVRYGIYDAEYDTARRIFSTGSGAGGALYENRDANGIRYVRCLYWYSGAWNWNYNWLTNDWNAKNPAVLAAIHFTSPPSIRGSFGLE